MLLEVGKDNHSMVRFGRGATADISQIRVALAEDGRVPGGNRDFSSGGAHEALISIPDPACNSGAIGREEVAAPGTGALRRSGLSRRAPSK